MPSNINPKREVLDRLFEQARFDEIAHLPDIWRVMHRDHTTRTTDCVGHVFGKSIPPWYGNHNWENTPEGYLEIEIPEKGDLIIYFEDSFPTHVALCSDKDRAESKWGVDPVFDHEIQFVPTYYGDNVRYFRKKNVDQMLKFLKERGDVVRFDKYMEEHLFGNCGYYNDKVTIGTHGDFITMTHNPEFAHILSLYLEHKGLTPADFLEIGGGEGTFKQNYIQYDPLAKYISVDVSKKLASKQAKEGGEATILSKANYLPAKDDSINGIIFSNELIDALACRVFKIGEDNRGHIIDKEGYVCVDGASIHFGFEEPDKDDFLTQYEDFLNQREDIYDLKQGDVISVAPCAEDVLRECCRVLKSGKVLFIDYGFSKRYIGSPRDAQEMPYYRGVLDFLGVEDIVKRPYDVDITYSIDFQFLEEIAKQINPNATVSHRPLSHIVKDVVRQYDPDTVPIKYHVLSKTSRFLALEIDIL